MDYGLQTYFLGRILYPRIWNAGSRRCEIQYDRIDHYYVALPCEPVYLSGQGITLWTNGGVDWYVYRLGCQKHHILWKISQQEMAGA